MTVRATLGGAVEAIPSARLGEGTWARAHEELVGILRDLIRLRTVNPPGDEILAARYLEEVLSDAGIPAELVEPFPGRGSISARLRGDGTGGEPLLLLSHTDVVPAPPELWSHDPFAGDLADGYIWGRGAVDMKAMVAMEVAVMRLLAAEARSAGRDPASDPVPGLRRDVLFTATADEEAGGLEGAGWVVDERPEWLRAAGALNEAGGVSFHLAGRRFYPIQVAEKGYVTYRITVNGTWGHGSVPRPDNAALLAAEVIARLGPPGPPRATPVAAAFFEAIAAAVDERSGSRIRRLLEPGAPGVALDRACDPIDALTAAALLRDTISTGVVHSGVKYNVIPGVARLELDCRTLPGTDEAAMRHQLRERIGEGLWSHLEVEPFLDGASVEASADTDLYGILERTLRDHDPDGIPLPAMAPFATDAKHTARLGVPTYGFSPLRLDPDEHFLARFHGVDERVSLEALRFGLPVLYDAVRRFCG